MDAIVFFINAAVRVSKFALNRSRFFKSAGLWNRMETLRVKKCTHLPNTLFAILLYFLVLMCVIFKF